MSLIQETLTACALFANLTPTELDEIGTRSGFNIRAYPREAVVAFEEDECSALGIVAVGNIHIQRIFPSGKLLTLETFRAGDSFGEALVFSDSGVYPATLIAKEDTTVLYIARAEIVQLCTRYPTFLANFMRTLSNRILLLNSKIKSLSYGTVRQKVAHFILEEHRRQNSDLLLLISDRQELADSLGIPRPSLSRELIALKAAGWIDFNRRTIKIIDNSALEQALK